MRASDQRGDAVRPARTRFFDGETAEDAPLFVDELDAGPRDRVTLHPSELEALEPYRAGARLHHPHHALERRALPRAIPAEQRHDFVLLHA